MSLPAGLVKLARPKQWAKNVLVFAAPAAAGVLDNRQWALDATVAFVSFCLAAAGTYYINDARDVEADRLHPKKSKRPGRLGRRACAPRLRPRRPAAGRRPGARLHGQRQPGLCTVRLRGAHDRLLVGAQARRRGRPRGRGRRVRAAGRGRRGGHRGPDLRLVLHRHQLRRPVHDLGQAGRRGQGDGRRRQRLPLRARAPTRRATPPTCGRSPRGRCWWPTACGRSRRPRRSPTPRSCPGTSSRSCRSSWRCCATRSCSTRGGARRPRRSCWATGPLQLIGIAWAIVFAIGVYTA